MIKIEDGNFECKGEVPVLIAEFGAIGYSFMEKGVPLLALLSTICSANELLEKKRGDAANDKG